MKRRQKISLFLLTVFAGLVLCSCSGGSDIDYSQAAPQTGGPEQGQWRDKQGTLLDLNSGKFTYQKAGANKTEGTYTMASGQISMATNGGATKIAQFPDQNGPITIDGESLVKTD